MPTVSVIVPNYNHAAFLDIRMESILNQTYSDFEVLILDDCSTDNSQAVLKKYEQHPKVKALIFNETNSGSPFKQWKKGIEKASGEYIWMAESDDYSDPRFLEKILPLFEKDTAIALAYSQSNDVNEKNETFRNRIFWTEDFTPNIWKNDFVYDGNQFIEQYMLYKNVIPNASAVVFKRSVFLESYDSVSAVMRMAGDWLLWVLMLKNNKIGFIASPLNYFRKHMNTTRVHNSNEKKIRRILEEAIIIKKASDIPTLKSSTLCQLSDKVLKKWFSQFPYFTDIFRKEFYKICQYNNITPIGLVYKKVYSKLNNRKLARKQKKTKG